MENSEKTKIGEETKSLFRLSSSWMRAYSITLIVVLTILLLLLLILFFQSQILFDLIGVRGAPEKRVVGMLNGFLIMGIVLSGIFIYAFVKLLMSGNKFNTISYSAKKDDVVSAFKNLRSYWAITGIGLIVVMIVAFYMGFKMIPAMR